MGSDSSRARLLRSSYHPIEREWLFPVVARLLRGRKWRAKRVPSAPGKRKSVDKKAGVVYRSGVAGSARGAAL